MSDLQFTGRSVDTYARHENTKIQLRKGLVPKELSALDAFVRERRDLVTRLGAEEIAQLLCASRSNYCPSGSGRFKCL